MGQRYEKFGKFHVNVKQIGMRIIDATKESRKAFTLRKVTPLPYAKHQHYLT